MTAKSPSPAMPDDSASAQGHQRSNAADTADLTSVDRSANPSENGGGGWFSMVGSVSFHFLLFLGLAWWTTRTTQGPAETETSRTVGIAVVHQMPDRTQFAVTDDKTENADDQLASDQQAVSETNSSVSPSASKGGPLGDPSDLKAQFASMLNQIRDAPGPSSKQAGGGGLGGMTGSDGRLDGVAVGEGMSDGAGGVGESATTVVFGVSGSGRSFVYVFDRSDSMNGYSGRPLRAAKKELIRSLGTLTERQTFSLIFYNERPTPFRLGGNLGGMVPADEGRVRLARQYVEGVRATGGTKHESALLMALRLAPDVIFFLTDANVPGLSRLQRKKISSRAANSGTTIHAIEFGVQPSPPSNTFLRHLAAENRGAYQYVNVLSLK